MKSKKPKNQKRILEKVTAVWLALLFMLSPIASIISPIATLFEPIAYAAETNSVSEKLVNDSLKVSNKDDLVKYFKDNNIYCIQTEAQLKSLSEYVNEGNNCYGKEIILLADITLNKEWIPIGDSDKHFRGTFNGNGYKINKLTINGDTLSKHEAGLFGYVGIDGIVKNLEISEANISANGEIHVGIIAGVNRGIIQNCKTSGESKSADNREVASTGGIVGYNEGKISSCENNANVTGTMVGGIAGYSKGYYIENCTNTGNIQGEAKVGGIVGETYSACIRCYNKGKIDGYIYIGGIAGYIENGKLNDCVNNGSVEGGFKDKKYIGGIVGSIKNPEELYNLTNYGSVKGNNCVGGIAGFVMDCGSWSNRYYSNNIKQLINTGNITGDGSIGGIFGGLVAKSIITIEKAYNSGEIIANLSESFAKSEGEIQNGAIGGLVGAHTKHPNFPTIIGNKRVNINQGYYYSDVKTKFSECYNLGLLDIENQNSTNENTVAGILGYFDSNTNLEFNNVHTINTNEELDKCNDIILGKAYKNGNTEQRKISFIECSYGWLSEKAYLESSGYQIYKENSLIDVNKDDAQEFFENNKITNVKPNYVDLVHDVNTSGTIVTPPPLEEGGIVYRDVTPPKIDTITVAPEEERSTGIYGTGSVVYIKIITNEIIANNNLTVKVSFGKKPNEYKEASYFSGSGSKELIYKYTIASGDSGELKKYQLSGTIQDSAGNTTNISKNGDFSKNNIYVDTVDPKIDSIIVNKVDGTTRTEIKKGSEAYLDSGSKIEIILKTTEVLADSSTAPTLEISFLKTIEPYKNENAKGTLTVTRADESTYTKYIYTYTINNDHGILEYKFTGSLNDKAENTYKLPGNLVTNWYAFADKTNPVLANIKAYVDDDDIWYNNYIEGEKTEIGNDVSNFYKVGTEIIIEVSSNEYLHGNSGAPQLEVSFGKSGVGLGKVECLGRRDQNWCTTYIYKYSITAKEDYNNLDIQLNDTGEWTADQGILNCKVTGIITDRSGNSTEYTKEEPFEKSSIWSVIADNTAPRCDNIIVGVVEGNEVYESFSGDSKHVDMTSTIELKMYLNESIDTENGYNPAPELEIYFSETGKAKGTTLFKKAEIVGYGTVFTYTYKVQDGDDGFVEGAVVAGELIDYAGNKNTLTRKEVKVSESEIYVDTMAPSIELKKSYQLGERYDFNADGKTNISDVSVLGKYVALLDNNMADDQITAVELKGDINADGYINVQDMSLLMKKIAGYKSSGPTNSEIITYTIEFSEDVYGFTMSDVDVDNGEITKFSEIQPYKIYEIDVATTIKEGDSAPMQFKIGLEKCYDSVGIYNNTISDTTQIDRKIPTVEMTSEQISIGDYSGYKVNFVWDELVTGFNSKDIKVDGAILTEFKKEDGSTYNAIIVPENDTNDIVISVLNDSCIDEARNVKETAIKENILEVPPEVTITHDVTNEDEIEYTFTWSEEINEFETSDIGIENGRIKEGEELVQDSTDNKVYRLKVTPFVSDGDEKEIIITIDEGVCYDALGIGNSTATYSTIVDKKAPVIEISEIPEEILIGEEIEITISTEDGATIQYSWDNQSWETYTNKITKTFAEIGEHTLYVKATDKIGNESEVVARTIVVSKVKFDIKGNVENWTKTNVELSVTTESEIESIIVTDEKGNVIIPTEGKYIIERNGIYTFVVTDKYGNEVTKTVAVTKIDKTAPVIPEETGVVVDGNKITIKATDENSGIAGYIIKENETDPTANEWITWNGSNPVEITKEDGIYYVWIKDNAGNVLRVENPIVIDTTAPTITFNSTLLTVTEGETIEATVTTNEDAKIEYYWSWVLEDTSDTEQHKTTKEFVKNIKLSKQDTKEGKYKLHVKAIDKYGNASEYKTLEFNVTKKDVEVPEIIFNDLRTEQINGIKYVKVSPKMTMQDITSKMNAEALLGEIPEYTNLTQDRKLKTGSEITLNGETKYVIIVNGDVNGDGKVDFLGDLILANNHRIGVTTLNGVQKLAADIDDSGEIDFINDIILINNYRLGIINTL